MKLRFYHLIVVLIVVALSGIGHGMWTHRWSAAPNQDHGRNLLEKIDEPIGEWEPGEFNPIAAKDVPPKSCLAVREFSWMYGEKKISVSINSGPPGIVAVHTPDICYLGAGFKLKSPVTRQTIDLPGGKQASFYVADFERTKESTTESVRVRWSWTTDGTWLAPEYPRWYFGWSARAATLYKLYIVHGLTEEDDLTKEDGYRKFVVDFVTTLSRHMAK